MASIEQAARPEVTLRAVTRENVRAVCRLQVRPDQERFVAPVAVSIAEAHFEPKAWFRAIFARDDPVGFVMLYEDPSPDGRDLLGESAGPIFFIWRFLIDGGYQRRGYGRTAMALLIEHVREHPNATALHLSVLPGEGSAEPFYRSFGFERTGRVHEGEVEMRLKL